MHLRFTGWFLSLALFLSAASRAALAADARPIDFSRDIKPILSNICFRCHGPDEGERKGGKDGLRLDQAAGATADLGDGSHAIVPGDPAKSELIKRITSQNPDEAMPPKSLNKKLTPHEIELLTQWVKEGGKYSNHWSYVKAVRPPPPKVRDAAWPKNEIDHFILARLESEGLAPAPAADRFALIRRVSLDLTGLPPTIDEVDAFVNDADPQAYEKLVDRLLQKPTYGEHWAHLWLDLARYADSAGYADDPARNIWLFRDYVIRSFNANKPFDQFTIEQIAGDLLPNPTADQLVATAFQRNTLTNNEGGTNDEEFRSVAIVDRVNTTMAVWMGTTIHCAQCHSHKYDPITQEEYFRLYAIYNNTEDADRGDESPLYSSFTDEQLKQKSQWEQQLAALRQTLKTPTPELQAAQAQWEQAFPLSLAWNVLKPAVVKSREGLQPAISPDGAVKVLAGAKTDVYTIEIPLDGAKIQGLRLEALPDDALPAKGPGRANGNFVITKIAAAITPPQGAALRGRYIRVEIPGKQKILSLAEVQAFQGTENVAPRGVATQSSVDYDGPAPLAIDGKTDGRYAEKSTTHTAVSDDPWWEVDLKAEQNLDRLTIWNRADNVEDRLSNFRVSVLNDKREPVWRKEVAATPKPSVELSLSGQREVEFAAALADYSQPGFDPGNVLKNPVDPSKGWAVGGKLGQPSTLTLVAKSPLEAPAGSKLMLTIEQNSNFENHTLGHFRLSATAEPRVAELAAAPSAVVDALRLAAAARKAEQQATIADYFQGFAPQLDAVRKQIADVQKQLADLKPETVPIMKELPMGQRRITKIQHRGNYLDLGKEVTEGVPAAFPPLPDGAPRNRLTLAKWLVDDNNPLTPRVIANRYWEQVFGVGIVNTSEEFGSQGEQPFHPELLDWLATEMIRVKWDTKAFLRTLVTSAAYRQSSRVTPDLQQRDPDNRLLARGPRFRLSAEMLRDQALAISGLLSPKMYGPPVKPPQPLLGVSAAFGGGIDWTTSMGDDKFRRGLYTTWRRSNPYPSMAAFDAPNREVCTVRRVRTNTPLQALVTLNDPVYIEASQALARKMVSLGGGTLIERARYGFRACLSRQPREEEIARLVKLYEQGISRFAKNSEEARQMATEPIGLVPKEMNPIELAAWTVVANVLLNLDETLMKR